MLLVPGRFPITIALIAAAIAPALLFWAEGAQAGQCLADTRQVKLDKKNVIRLREYLCRRDRETAPSFRVQFQRLNETAAGVLLNGGKSPWFDRLYGAHTVVSNETFKEYKYLIEHFGTPTREKDVGKGGGVHIWMNVRSSGQTEDIYVGEGDAQGRTLQSFRLPSSFEPPLLDETLHLFNADTWPPNFGMYYYRSGVYEPHSNKKFDFLDRITLWRYITIEDIMQYPRHLKEYHAMVGGKHSDATDPKANAMLQYLAKAGWPERFLHVTMTKGFCEGVLEASTNRFPLAVDIALVENLSNTALTLEQLLGKNFSNKTLRRAADTSTTFSTDIIEEQPIGLQPHEKIIIPLRILFLTSQNKTMDEEQKSSSIDIYNKIQSRPSGTVLTSEVISDVHGNARAGKEKGAFVVRKVRESFKAPSYPEEDDYAFGPEWVLTGLTAGGERTFFKPYAPNFLDLTAGSETGSCPILYAWDDDQSRWLRHGKILHKAQTEAKLDSESIAFDGFVSQFKVSEEELERFHLEGARLIVKLNNGGSRELKPAMSSLAPWEDQPTDIYANGAVEVRFVLPKGIEPRDVVRSNLTVSGFYDRYTALLLSRLIAKQSFLARAGSLEDWSDRAVDRR